MARAERKSSRVADTAPAAAEEFQLGFALSPNSIRRRVASAAASRGNRRFGAQSTNFASSHMKSVELFLARSAIALTMPFFPPRS
jgi:hypothetical protein